MEIVLKIIVWILTLILIIWEYVSAPPGSPEPVWLVIKIIILIIVTIIIVIEWRQKKPPALPGPKTLPPDTAPIPGPDAPRPKR